MNKSGPRSAVVRFCVYHSYDYRPNIYINITELVDNRDTDPEPDPPHFTSHAIKATFDFLTRCHSGGKSLVSVLCNSKVCDNRTTWVIVSALKCAGVVDRFHGFGEILNEFLCKIDARRKWFKFNSFAYWSLLWNWDAVFSKPPQTGRFCYVWTLIRVVLFYFSFFIFSSVMLCSHFGHSVILSCKEDYF